MLLTKMSSITAKLAASATTLLTSCTYVSSAGGNSEFSVEKNVRYAPEKWPVPLVADIYKPDSETPTPAVLLIHGGGWNEKERRGDMTGIARSLAKRGYLVMNTTYRLTPEWKFPAQEKDMRQSLEFMRSNSGSLNLDPDRIATFGYSAGGHLAALTGFDPENNVKVVVAGGAPTDLSFWPDGKLTGLLLGGPLEGNEKIYREASPVTHVRPTSPPVFIYHGTGDDLVPVKHADALISALEKNGVEHETYWIKGRSHIMAHLFSAQAVPKVIDFLDHHLRKPPVE